MTSFGVWNTGENIIEVSIERVKPTTMNTNRRRKDIIRPLFITHYSTVNKKEILRKVISIVRAYNSGKMGDIHFPEDSKPDFKNLEEKISYYTLPMSINYQRDSYTLWINAKKTFEDKEAKCIFDVNANLDETSIRDYLMRYKLALQPNNHVKIWKTILQTVRTNFNSFENLINENDKDYLKLRDCLQMKNKKGFPYLSGPKIFNYWVFILMKDVGIEIKNKKYIEIAPDTHVIKASVKLGLITEQMAKRFSKEEVSKIWRELLENSVFDPIDVHEPLWFWSKGGFKDYG